MDETLLSNPTVQSQITEGTAMITGMKDAKEAASLASQIESGSLPFSLESSSHSTISPSLGMGALDVMAKAGIVAFILVCIFMLLYYRLLGFVACIALTIQATGQLLAVSVPQFTLTLPGIAAIILSIGMGVDANVIISERIREELKSGKSLPNAIKTGFHQAFSSVFDGNITVIIAAIVLMIFGSGSMLSFGYSMLTGVLLNFVAGVTASRLMVLSLSSFKAFSNPVLYGARKEKI
jgi:protein-export membrane protein, SecD/SecF family